MTDKTPDPCGSDSSAELGYTTWYEVLFYYGTETLATITAVRVAHETEHQIVLADVAKGNARRRKVDGYFRTWGEAHQHLMDKADKELTEANAKLQRAKTRHFNVSRMLPNHKISRP
jgi:hypothetical protein